MNEKRFRTIYELSEAEKKEIICRNFITHPVIRECSDFAAILDEHGTVTINGIVLGKPFAVHDWQLISRLVNGRNHIVGLKADGTVVACGDNSCGQCEVSTYKNVSDINAMRDGTILVLKDGSSVTLGNTVAVKETPWIEEVPAVEEAIPQTQYEEPEKFVPPVPIPAAKPEPAPVSTPRKEEKEKKGINKKILIPILAGAAAVIAGVVGIVVGVTAWNSRGEPGMSASSQLSSAVLSATSGMCNSIEEYIKLPENQIYMDLLNNADSTSIGILDMKAEGNALVSEIRCTSNQSSAAADYLNSYLETSDMKSNCNNLINDMKNKTTVSDPYVIVRYLNSDGSLLAEKTFRGTDSAVSSASAAESVSLEGTSWQIEKVSIKGTEKTMDEYRKENGVSGELRMYCEFAKDTVVFHTVLNGKDSTDTNHYTYENGSLTLLDVKDENGENITGTVEGNIMKMVWGNNYYLLSKI